MKAKFSISYDVVIDLDVIDGEPVTKKSFLDEVKANREQLKEFLLEEDEVANYISENSTFATAKNISVENIKIGNVVSDIPGPRHKTKPSRKP